MAKSTKATNPKKGGRKLSDEVVKKSEESPEALEEEDLAEIFGDIEEDVQEEPATEKEPDEEIMGHKVVKPTVEPVTDGDLEDEEEEEVVEEKPKRRKKKPTQVAEEEEEEETPTSLDQTDLMELLPEKFRGEDLSDALKKMSGSYGELESRQDRIEQELSETTKILKSLGAPAATKPEAKPSPKPTDFQIDEEEEAAVAAALEGVDFLEDPTVPLKKIYSMARQAAARDIHNSITQYDAVKQRVDEFNRFKAEHPDFDEHKPEMMEVLQANPHLDTPESVGLVYNKAKELKAMRATTVRKEATEQVLSSEDFKTMLENAKAEAAAQAQKELLERLKTGEVMKGTLTSQSTKTPTPKSRTGEGDKKKVYRIVSEAGEFKTDDEELAGIIAAEGLDDRGLIL